MAAEPVALGDDAQLVDAIARRVVELLEGTRARAEVARPASDTGRACLTVSQVAARYRVSRSWVYAHQRQLGAMRLGDGPRARLRFDPKVVADAITAFDRDQRPAEPPQPHRRQPRGVRLIEFEKLR
jgi:hypothetical protein